MPVHPLRIPKEPGRNHPTGIRTGRARSDGARDAPVTLSMQSRTLSQLQETDGDSDVPERRLRRPLPPRALTRRDELDLDHTHHADTSPAAMIGSGQTYS